MIVNLTPHELTWIVGGVQIATYPSNGLARLESESVEAGYVRVNGNIWMPVIATSFGYVTGLPDPVEGTIYVVSLPVAAHVRRSDVYSPDVVRDDAGRVIGMKGLVSHA